MKHNSLEETWSWLQATPAFDELCAEYPQEWEIVQHELADIIASGKPEDLKAYLERSAAQEALSIKQLQQGKNRNVSHINLAHVIRNRMAHLAIKRCCLSVATGVTKGKARFNLFNGYMAQKLLFSKGLERKPVSLFWFRLMWPLLWQKKLLMPLVQSKGIYCFYSRALIAALVKLIGNRPCLEIAAGDGTLSRFLSDHGIQVSATDNHGWKQVVQYPEHVAKLDARTALATHNPEVVICSWPPANNDFERHVFATDSVQLYIVISSRHSFASGNWGDYRKQSLFTFAEDKLLSRLVLPPELESSVYVFRRKTA